jgi:hypothetical protein
MSAACSGAGLVDEDVVDLVDDGEGVVVGAAVLWLGAAAVLDLLLEADRHVVAQIVKAELGVGPVGDVSGVGSLLLVVGLHVLQDPDRDTEEVIQRLHPQRVASGQIVVDGDDVNAATSEGVEHDGGGCRQRLALAGAHLGDGAVVEHHAADQLHVEVPHAHRPARRLAHEGEGLGQQIVQ